MAGLVSSIGQILLPKGKGTRGGAAYTPTFNPKVALLQAPRYRDHLDDIYSTRQAQDSRALLATLFNTDPDISAAVHAYLTIAESADMVVYAYDLKGAVDVKGIELANQILAAVTTTSDYTLGYSGKPSRGALLNDLRYMALLRGSIATELVLNKQYQPDSLRVVDTAQLRWNEKVNGRYTPEQKPASSSDYIDLDIPTFFTANFHQSPMTAYTFSAFVSAINTIAARQEVINELYRIMKVVGYPRLDIEVLEDVLAANAPTAFRSDPKKVRTFVEQEIAKVQAQFASIRSDQALVHSSAITAKIINDKNPGAGMQIQGVIDVLDGQNQASLKVMPAVVGKGDNGQTVGVEARLFAMSADALNSTVGDLMSQALTLAVRLAGYQGRIDMRFLPVEMRPQLELEPQKVMKSARLRQELSLGTITDIEYHLEIFGRPPPPGAPTLSGTNFLTPDTAGAEVDTQNISPNSDPLGKSLAPPGGKSAKSNSTKSGSVVRG